NRWAKVGIVLAGYAAAFVVTCIAVALYDMQFTAADNQTMGGMIAGGELMYGSGVFVLACLVPTGLALWFARNHPPPWSVFSTICLTFAGGGLVAAVSALVPSPAFLQVPLLTLVGFMGIMQMMGSPVFIAGFGLFGLLAPAGDLRQRMLTALGIEVV